MIDAPSLETRSVDTPRKACVIGDPVAHSRSPIIHGYWLKEYGIDGRYLKEEVKADDFSDFIKGLAASGYCGANVTLPHKEMALQCADEVDNAARSVGAANTLWFEGDRLIASNTDIYGFMSHLAVSSPTWNTLDRPVAFLGAGGAARAVIRGLLDAGVTELRIFNRTRARAEALQAFFGDRLKVFDWDQRSSMLGECGLLINGTQLGMAGGHQLDIDLSKLPNDATVYDIVYTPLETPLLREAGRLGFTPVDGLGMLLHQAVPGFEKWFGVRPDVSADLRQLVVDDLGADKC